MAIKVELHGAGESRTLTVNQHIITGSRERTWAKVAAAIASEVRTPETTQPPATAVEPKQTLSELLTEVDAKLCITPPPVRQKRQTVRDAEIARGLEPARGTSSRGKALRETA